MAFRVSFQFFQQTAKMGGWTENYWNSLADLSAVQDKANDLALSLDGLHGNTTFMPAIRISDASSFRDVKLITRPGAQTPGTSAQSVSDYPTNALLLRHLGVGNYRVQQWIKGIWDSVIAQGGYYTPNSDYQSRMLTFRTKLALATNGWVLRVLDRTQALKPIKDITQAGVVTCTGHGYLDNAKVRISRCKGLTQANTVWRITRIDADSFSLQGWVAPNPAIPYLGGGVVRLQSYTYVSIMDSVVQRATEHAVGRPLEQLIGRRRTRRT